MLYKAFTYMILARVENVLNVGQPEEPHGARPGYRLERHLITAIVVIDKLLAISVLVWMGTLVLSKTFDRVNWAKLWVARCARGVSNHIVWWICCWYWQQKGCFRGNSGGSKNFVIECGRGVY